MSLPASKSVLVTGASSPIGKAIAHALAAQQWNLLLHTRSQPEALALYGAELQEEFAGLQVDFITADLRDHAATKAALRSWSRASEATFGPLVGLVANAAGNHNGLVARAPIEKVQELVELNLVSVYNCTQVLLRSMVRESAGRIVLIGSTAGIAGNAGQAGYAMTKAGLGGLARSLAREYGSRNITANVVAPGWVHTPMSAETLADSEAEILAGIPLQRLGKPEEVAAAVQFFMSTGAGYITGQTLMVNGGLYM